jgi:hypothetical protein
MYSEGNRFDHYNNYEADDDFPPPLNNTGRQYYNLFTLLCIAILSSYSTAVNFFSWYRIAKYFYEASA